MKSKYKPYPSYRDSGVEWLGKIPEGWIKSKIKFTSSIFGRIGFRGYTTADIVEEGKGAVTLSPSNIKNNKMVYTKLTYLNWDKYYESPEIQIKIEDVVFVKTGSTLGKVGYIDILPHEMTLNPQLIVFKELKCHSKYLYYILNSTLIKAYVDNSNNGGTIPTMTQESILNYEIPSCVYTEQKIIANYLDNATAKIDTLIEKQTKLIALLKEKRQAVISTAVTRGLDNTVAMKDSGVEWLGEIPAGWGKVSMKWISNIYAGGTPDKTNLSYWTDGTIPWINSGEVNQFFITKPTTYITKEAYANSSAKWIRADSLVMALAGQGKTKGMVARLGIETTCNQSMAAIETINEYESRLLLWWITANYQRIRNMAGGDLRDGLNLDLLSNMPCPSMPLEEQKLIADYLDDKTTKIDTLIIKNTKAMELLKEKRTALISSAVTGKIDVREIV